MKGYKITNPDYTCLGKLYEVGKEYSIDGNLKLCSNGIHFCVKPEKCFDYYSFDSKNHIFEIDAIGNIIGDENDKMCTNKIVIVKEILWMDLMLLINKGNNNNGINNAGHQNAGNQNLGNQNLGDQNTGNRNLGHWNAGHWNAGHWNAGNQNLGNQNAGNQNLGNQNTGNQNLGHWNTGNQNLGDQNTGNQNLGDQNTGHWNTTNKSNGIFCTIEPKIKIFNIDSNFTLSEFENSKYYLALNSEYFEFNKWVNFDNMSLKEIKDHPYSEKMGGYLKSIPYKTACKIWWNKLTNENKEIIKSIPNFDSKIFKKITGIKI
jgi:hypothetical protein